MQNVSISLFLLLSLLTFAYILIAHHSEEIVKCLLCIRDIFIQTDMYICCYDIQVSSRIRSKVRYAVNG